MKFSKVLQYLGFALIFISVAILILTFLPPLKEEVNYVFYSQKNETNYIEPIDKEFGIIIPKINANAKIIKNVDPYNSLIYQSALSEGVAHANGTPLPGEPGRIFLFSHSSVNFYDALRYNSVFYLLSKLEWGDEIILYSQNKPYKYKVIGTEKVNPNNVDYISDAYKPSEEFLTLMTCWPLGSTYKRLLVHAQRVE